MLRCKTRGKSFGSGHWANGGGNDSGLSDNGNSLSRRFSRAVCDGGSATEDSRNLSDFDGQGGGGSIVSGRGGCVVQLSSVVEVLRSAFVEEVGRCGSRKQKCSGEFHLVVSRCGYLDSISVERMTRQMLYRKTGKQSMLLKFYSENEGIVTVVGGRLCLLFGGALKERKSIPQFVISV